MFTVSLYTRPDCQPCKAVKRVLKACKVVFDEIPITEENRAYIALQGFTAAPVLILEHHSDPLLSASMGGFNPDLLKKICDLYHMENLGVNPNKVR